MKAKTNTQLTLQIQHEVEFEKLETKAQDFM